MITMRSPIFIGLLSALITGCATVPTDFHQVWMEPAPPPANLAAPAQFKITPLEAYKVLVKMKASPTNTNQCIWHIYADSRAYYFLDIHSVPNPNARAAYVHGEQIEGQQGLMLVKFRNQYY